MSPNDDDISPRWHKREFWAAITVVVSVTAVLVSAAVLHAAGPADAPFSNVSNVGSAVAVPPSADAALRRAVRNGQANGAQHLLATRGDRAFYRIGNGENRDCFAVGPAGSQVGYRFGMIQCSTTFPSPEYPVLPFILVRGEGGARPSICMAEGFVADGVMSMVLQDGRGSSVAKAPVEGNVFRFESIPDGSTTLLGLDSEDNVVYSLPLRLG